MSQNNIQDICRKVRVVPVLVIDDVNDAEPLAKTLYEGGLEVLEVTLRTPQAWEVALTMKKTCPKAVVGVGSVKKVEDLQKAKDAGLDFAVSPGCTVSLLREAKKLNLPLLPGVATASEALMAYEEGYEFLKFFPADINGGVKALNALAAPLGSIRFCPTGGVNVQNVKEYLSCPNVICVGGSWLVPALARQNKDWAAIAKIVQDLKDVLK